jgi:hypothetical protein
MDKNLLALEIKNLANILDSQYRKELNLRNHCFLRIAYDNVVMDKWDKIMNRPFTKYANIEQLNQVSDLLKIYKLDTAKLVVDNKRSLYYRKIVPQKDAAIEFKLF